MVEYFPEGVMGDRCPFLGMTGRLLPISTMPRGVDGQHLVESTNFYDRLSDYGQVYFIENASTTFYGSRRVSGWVRPGFLASSGFGVWGRACGRPGSVGQSGFLVASAGLGSVDGRRAEEITHSVRASGGVGG